MATTMTAPVSNSIALAQKYLPILDEIYKDGAKSSILDTNEYYVRWIGAKTIQLFNSATVGLGNYSRNAGFEVGDATQGWETYTLNVDRGRSFSIDVMDNDETIGMAFGSVMGEFERVHVVPEVDAYRFAKYAQMVKAGAKTNATDPAGNGVNIASQIDAGMAYMDELEVPHEGRIAFISPSAYENLKANVSRYTLNLEKDINNNIEMYNDLRLVKVPQARFATVCTLNDGANHGDMGGFTIGGNNINFLIVDPRATMQVVKHLVPRVFSPEVNQEADAWKFDYRIYHDCFVQAQKLDGLYLGLGTAIASA